MRPRESFSEFANVYFFCARFSEKNNMRPMRKDKRGVRERFVKVFLITKNGRLQIKEFRTTAFYNYIYIYIDMYYIYI